MKLNFKNKKGALSWEYIVVAAIVLVVLIVVLMIFTKGAKSGGDSLIDKIEGTKLDQDKDGVPDYLDKCPCDSDVGGEWTKSKNTKDKCTPCQE